MSELRENERKYRDLAGQTIGQESCFAKYPFFTH